MTFICAWVKMAGPEEKRGPEMENKLDTISYSKAASRAHLHQRLWESIRCSSACWGWHYPRSCKRCSAQGLPSESSLLLTLSFCGFLLGSQLFEQRLSCEYIRVQCCWWRNNPMTESKASAAKCATEGGGLPRRPYPGCPKHGACLGMPC